MPSARRSRPPRGFGGGTNAPLSTLAQCRKCGATCTAYVSADRASVYLPTDNGRHAGCGGRFGAVRNRGAT